MKHRIVETTQEWIHREHDTIAFIRDEFLAISFTDTRENHSADIW